MEALLRMIPKIYFAVFVVSCMLTVVAAQGQPRQDATARKPNILLILTDDQGYHDVSYYGTKDIRTPNIDRISREGMRFDNFYANAPVCSPTRAALLSGRYPDYVGVPGLIRYKKKDNWGYLDPKTVLLPALLKNAGYHTAMVGKWNLGLESPNTPNEHGFAHFHGWLEDMMDDYWKHTRNGINYMRLNEETITPEGHATDLFTEWAVDYIKSEENDDTPFFLYLAYNAPHFPVQPPEAWLQKVMKRNPGMDETRAKLVALIEHLDEGIGKVVQALRASGQFENTLIIFTSDNGGHLPSLANNGPLRDGKQSMYEGGLRVPTCIAWPGVIKPGSVSDQVNLSMDLYPTLAAITGARIFHTIEGRSFLPTLLGESMKAETRPLYFTRREGGLRYGGKAYHALRLGDWKLLQNSPYEPMELYNLKKDPKEMNNVIDSEPQMYKQLNELLMVHIQRGGRVPWQKPVDDLQE